MHDTPTENSGAIHVRLHGPLFEHLENWRRSQPKIPSRSDASAIPDRTGACEDRCNDRRRVILRDPKSISGGRQENAGGRS